MSEEYEEPGHGDSPAAWTAVVLMLVGVTAATAFFLFDMPILVWASVAFTVIGLGVGILMARAGLGVKGPRYSSQKDH